MAALGHRAICIDDEGGLDCVCGIGNDTPLPRESRCGIHGDPTWSGRCASCDAERANP